MKGKQSTTSFSTLARPQFRACFSPANLAVKTVKKGILNFCSLASMHQVQESSGAVAGMQLLGLLSKQVLPTRPA